MNWTLEVVLPPVADVERAKAFYDDQVGFDVDVDTGAAVGRVVQLTPAGSGCSIQVGDRLTAMVPGSVEGLQLVVADLPAAHAELAGRGVAVAVERAVGVMAGDVGNQALRAGLIDEIRLEPAPLVLGRGRHLLGHDGAPTAMPENPVVIEGDRVTRLSYAVRKP